MAYKVIILNQQNPQVIWGQVMLGGLWGDDKFSLPKDWEKESKPGSMAFFIIADDADCGPLEAISRSKEMMKGNKWKLFCLHWRFFGWALLAAFFTFGIGYLWLVPYMQTSFAKFYEDVK